MLRDIKADIRKTVEDTVTEFQKAESDRSHYKGLRMLFQGDSPAGSDLFLILRIVQNHAGVR